MVTGDNDGLLALGAAVERGHGVARVCPEEHAAHRAVEARRLTHRHLPYSLHGEPGERAARVAQHEGARTGGSEHGDHHAVRVMHVVRARTSCPLFSPDHPAGQRRAGSLVAVRRVEDRRGTMRSSHDNVYGTPTSHHTVDGIRFVLHHSFRGHRAGRTLLRAPRATAPQLQPGRLRALGDVLRLYQRCGIAHTPHP